MTIDEVKQRKTREINRLKYYIQVDKIIVLLENVQQCG